MSTHSRTAADSRCMVCEWTSASDLEAVRAAGPAGGFDLVLGADVCYGQSALPAVIPTSRALQLISALTSPKMMSRLLLCHRNMRGAIIKGSVSIRYLTLGDK